MSTGADVGERTTHGRGLTTVRAFWHRLPVAVRAVLTGLAAAAAGTMPWAVLASANQKHWSTVPWAVPPTALYLWLYWRYVRGEGWPRSTAEARRTNCRANPLSDDVWARALLAGVLGLVTVILLQGLTSRLVTLPRQEALGLSRYPLGTALLWVIMSAIVAGVAEETSFRGYLQRPIRAATWAGSRDPGDRRPVWIRAFHPSRNHVGPAAVLSRRCCCLWCAGVPDRFHPAWHGPSCRWKRPERL